MHFRGRQLYAASSSCSNLLSAVCLLAVTVCHLSFLAVEQKIVLVEVLQLVLSTKEASA